MNAQSAIENGFCDGLWETDREAFAEATAPAAMMRGRDYAPAAYMARMREKAPQPPEAPDGAQIITQALALVRESLNQLND